MNRIQEIRINNFKAVEPAGGTQELNNLSWEPLDAIAGSFRTTKMVARDGKIVFEQTAEFKKQALILCIPLVAVIAWPTLSIFYDFFHALPFMLGGLYFAYIGVKVFLQNSNFVFDRWNARYFRGRSFDKRTTKPASQQSDFKNIYALQIIPNRVVCSRRHTSSTHHQLNLVLKNGERVNIMSDLELAYVEECARQMARILDVEVMQAQLG